MDLSSKKVLFVIAPKDFRDEELIEPRRVLEGYKARTIVANSTGKTSIGMFGARIEPNFSLDNIKINDYDAIVFVGGSGCNVYMNDKYILNLAKEAELKGKVVASICLASGILANAGVLKGKEATGWETTKNLVELYGGDYTGSDLEVCGKIITAKGPSVSKKFGEAIAKALSSGNYTD